MPRSLGMYFPFIITFFKKLEASMNSYDYHIVVANYLIVVANYMIVIM